MILRIERKIFLKMILSKNNLLKSDMNIKISSIKILKLKQILEGIENIIEYFKKITLLKMLRIQL